MVVVVVMVVFHHVLRGFGVVTARPKHFSQAPVPAPVLAVLP